MNARILILISALTILTACGSVMMGAPDAMSRKSAHDGAADASILHESESGYVANRAAPGPLRAGALDDNEKWDDYQKYLARYRGEEVLPVDVSERLMIHVIDRRERPVAGADVRITAGGEQVARLRTYGDGRTVFFPRALPELASAETLEVEARSGSLRIKRTIKRRVREDWTLVLPGAVALPRPTLELVFLLDATGSMGDEIARIQATLTSVTRRIKNMPGAPAVRWGLVAYRDRGDEYVTRRWKLTDDVAGFNARLMQVGAAGGGDYREALNAGLHRAVRDMDWSDPRALRLVFLVADAPPKLDRQDVVPYPRSIAMARELGVKIYPIAASGLDAAGEYVYRQLAQQTLARFCFISYGGTTTHEVGPYVENNLDSLIVDIVRRELGQRTRRTPAAAQPRRPLSMPNGE